MTARPTNQTAEAQMRGAMSCPFEGGRGITPCRATNLQWSNASRGMQEVSKNWKLVERTGDCDCAIRRENPKGEPNATAFF